MANDKLDYVETGERQSVDCSPAHVEAPVYYAWTQINAEKSAELSQCVCYVSGVEGECRRRKRLHLFGESPR